MAQTIKRLSIELGIDEKELWATYRIYQSQNKKED